MLVAVAPITMSILGLIFIEGFTNKQGFAILGAIPLTLAFTFILWKKGIVKQVMIDENGVEHDME